MPDINGLLYLNISVETVQSIQEYFNNRYNEIGKMPYSKITQKLKDEYEYVNEMRAYLSQWLNMMEYKKQQMDNFYD